MQFTGRKQIFTPFREINSENLITVLEKALPIHLANASECEYLLRYERGIQPLQREKKYRSDIDIRVSDNVAHEVVRFHKSYFWSSPITLVQANKDDTKNDAILELNKCYQAENDGELTQQLADFVEICGHGYTFIEDKNIWSEGDSYFTKAVFDPRYAFIVYSNYYVDKRPMLGVTFNVDEDETYYLTCYTDSKRFEVVGTKIRNGKKVKKSSYNWNTQNGTGESNRLGKIPLVEWYCSHDRMGIFERELADMDALNILESDFVNSVDQNTQCIWHGNDLEFAKDENGNEQTAKSGDWVITQTTPDGKTPFINPLQIDYDYGGIQNHIITKRTLILQKCDVPQRNDNSGGSTGIAMSDATGWSHAEATANAKQQTVSACKMNEVKLCLTAINKCLYTPIDSPIKTLNYSDVEPNFKRQKTYELTVKANAIATLIAHGFNGEDVITEIPLFEDPNSTWQRSKDGIEKFQAKLFNTGSSEPEGRSMQDESDQIENSPSLDANRG